MGVDRSPKQSRRHGGFGGLIPLTKAPSFPKLDIPVLRFDLTSRFYGFQTGVLCHEVSHRELFANIPPLPFVLLTVFFQSSPMIHDNR